MKAVDTAPFDFRMEPNADNYAVMGNPIAHSKSPRIHQAFARQTRQSIHYQPILVAPDKFREAALAFRDAGGKGLNITVPFKEQAWKLATIHTSRASIAGAVNTLTFESGGTLHGDNTDGAGLVRDMDRNQILLTDRRILILGAGGAVRGVLGPLLDRKPDSVWIANRTLARAQTLVDGLTAYSNLKALSLNALTDAGQFDLVINAISSGLQGDMPPLPVSLVNHQTCCYDMVYGERETVFVKWAKKQGVLCALDGLGMLVEQAAEAFYLWRGVRPETEPVITLLRG